MILERTTLIPAPLPDVFAFFSDPSNLGRITPPEMRFRITRGPSRPLQENDIIEYAIRVAGVPVKWRTRITLWRPNEAFADLQERGPYRFWLHTHTFREIPSGVEMHDHVQYELPLGMLGRIAAGWFVARQLRHVFDYRGEVIRRYFTKSP